MNKIIRVENIDFSYNKPNTFIKNMSFTIEKGSYVCLLGSNGSGKSTLGKLLSGLISTDKGDIFIDGLKINKDNLNKIRDYVTILFQNPDNQYVASSLKDDIIFGLENHNIPKEDMDVILEKVSDICDVKYLLNRDPSSMSGGEKQKGNIASMIALNPKVLILDESYSMLDPKSKKEVKKLIKKLQIEKNITIISITHDADEVLNADRVLVMDKGDIVFDGNINEFYNFNSDIYGINAPYIFQLEKELGLKEYLKEEEFIQKVGETL